jgi:hypothetical protein
VIQHSNATLSRLSFELGDTPAGRRAADELRERDHGLTGLVHPVRLAGSFRACAACAYDEDVCTCEHRDIRNYPGQVLHYGKPLSRPITVAQVRDAKKATAPARPTGPAAELTIRTSPRGWIIEATSEGTLPFRMGLAECDCNRTRVSGGACAYGYHPEQVVSLLKRIAETYPRGTKVPAVLVRPAAAVAV